ncbi:MAG TPA: hypothetical protein VGM80_13485 [Gaiellaceae bacterium]
MRGYTGLVPWILKGLLVGLKTRRGRELALAGALGALRLARSERARKAYAHAWKTIASASGREGPVRKTVHRVVARARP